jgi:two-component system CheB/CheR fusion protein
VRLLPYRTTEDRIEGAVMTFFDISGRREAEEKVRAGEARMRLVAESTKDYAIITDGPRRQASPAGTAAPSACSATAKPRTGSKLDFLFLPGGTRARRAGRGIERARADRPRQERTLAPAQGRQPAVLQRRDHADRKGDFIGYAMIARDD